MLTALLLAMALGAGATPSAHLTRGVRMDSLPQFPSVEGSNLEGRRFSLPADFETEYSIVFVAFRREQQADVDSWLPYLRGLGLDARGIGAYELPTLSRSYRWMRGFIDGGMARGIPDRRARETTITLYIEKEPFRVALAISNEDQITTMLVARDGRVLWRVNGPFTPAAGEALAAALAGLTPAPDPRESE